VGATDDPTGDEAADDLLSRSFQNKGLNKELKPKESLKFYSEPKD